MPRWSAYILIGSGVLLATAALFLLVKDPSPATRSPGTDPSEPSSVKISPRTIASYTVAPELPKYIEIPAIQVPESRVMPLGLTKSNQIASPANIYDAGWYKGSSKPGAKGTMFIYGHVSSWRADGLFHGLGKLKPGDVVRVTRGDDKVYTYRVMTSRRYPYDHVDMNKVLSPVNPSQPGLNLMTCAGHLIKGTNEFDERLVVFASQMD